ncbi:hypothetical protein QYZ45_21005 [Vibrio parahaemolyticus]|nr:hypothetical protein [Vibrio parahaemolyticus]
MKSVFFWLFKLLLVVGVLVANANEVTPNGAVNILILWAWIEAIFLFISALCHLNNDVFDKLVCRIEYSSHYKWITVFNRFWAGCIACSFVYFGYWLTGIALLIGFFSVHLVIELANDKAKEKA